MIKFKKKHKVNKLKLSDFILGDTLPIRKQKKKRQFNIQDK